MQIMGGGRARGVVANVLEYDYIVSKFKFQSRYYGHFRTNNLRAAMNSLLTVSYGLDSIIIILLQVRLWH